MIKIYPYKISFSLKFLFHQRTVVKWMRTIISYFCIKILITIEPTLQYHHIDNSHKTFMMNEVCGRNKLRFNKNIFWCFIHPQRVICRCRYGANGDNIKPWGSNQISGYFCAMWDHPRCKGWCYSFRRYYDE